MKDNINTPKYWDDFYKDKQVDLVNTLRQDKYLELIKGSKKVVELGCGLSSFCIKASLQCEEVWGVDFAKETIDKLKKDYPSVFWTQSDARRTWFRNNCFDAVVSGELIEHMEKPEELLREMYRICKPGGLMVLSTPILEFDDPEHLWEFKEEDVQRMLSVFGDTKTEVIASDKFPGRSYIFGVCQKRLS